MVLVLALATVLALSASAQAGPSKVSFDVPHGQFAAYSIGYAGDGKKVNIKMTYSPLDPADEGKPNAESVILDVYSPKNPAPKGPAIGAAGGNKGTKNFQLESNVAGNYTLVVHNWNSQKRTVSVTLEKVGAHSFNVVSPDGKSDYVAPCQSCHPGITDFKLTAKADYDGNGKAESVQAEVAGLLHALEKAINDSGIRSIQGYPYFNRDDTAKANDKQRNAIYNYLFVRGLEGSDGKAAAIHNFKRSVMLLQLSYKDLTGKDLPNATLMQ